MVEPATGLAGTDRFSSAFGVGAGLGDSAGAVAGRVLVTGAGFSGGAAGGGSSGLLASGENTACPGEGLACDEFRGIGSGLTPASNGAGEECRPTMYPMVKNTPNRITTI